MKIGFIGLGDMGAPMAHSLLKAGHVVHVFDLDAQAVEVLVDAGAKAAASAKAAVTDVECVITILPSAAHVRSVLSADDGVLAGIAKGVTIIDSSTIDPASVKAFAELVAQHGNTFVDAPVSGGTDDAAAGTLTFMVGGSATVYEQVKPVLLAMGKLIVHCGDTGMGQVANTCNNLMLGITMGGVGEAMSLGAVLGIDPKVLAGIMKTSTGRCWSSDMYNRPDGEVSEYSGSDMDRPRSAIADVGRAPSGRESWPDGGWVPMNAREDIQELVDCHRIRSVINQYCRAIDRVDVELWKDVYWEDAVHNHGAFDGRAWDFVEFAAPQVAKYFATTQHNISNINYDLRGSVAYTESYLLAFHRIAGDPATLNAVFGTEYATRQQEEADFHDYVLVGRYLDRFEKRGGRWRIAERTVVQDWNINQPGSAIFNDAIVNVIKRRSARDRTDLSYFREGEGE